MALSKSSWKHQGRFVVFWLLQRNLDIQNCLNPKPLNWAVKRPHCYPPTLDVLMTKLAGCKYFSSLDQSSGYWNVQVDKESQELLTFNTLLASTHLPDSLLGWTAARMFSKGQLMKPLATYPMSTALLTIFSLEQRQERSMTLQSIESCGGAMNLDSG